MIVTFHSFHFILVGFVELVFCDRPLTFTPIMCLSDFIGHPQLFYSFQFLSVQRVCTEW